MDIEIIAEIPRPPRRRSIRGLTGFRKDPPKSMKEILGPQNCEFIIHPSVVPKRQRGHPLPPPRSVLKDNHEENGENCKPEMEAGFLLDLGTHFLLADSSDYSQAKINELNQKEDEENEELQESDSGPSNGVNNEELSSSASETRWIGWGQPIKENRLRCHICGARFTHVSGKKSHIDQVHLKVRKFNCDHCADRFVRKDQLRSHVKKHHARKLRYGNMDKNYKYGRKRLNR